MYNFVDVMYKRLVFPLVMNIYAIFHTFSIIEVEFANVKTEKLLKHYTFCWSIRGQLPMCVYFIDIRHIAYYDIVQHS